MSSASSCHHRLRPYAAVKFGLLLFLLYALLIQLSLQCCDTVSWVTGRACSRRNKLGVGLLVVTFRPPLDHYQSLIAMSPIWCSAGREHFGEFIVRLQIFEQFLHFYGKTLRHQSIPKVFRWKTSGTPSLRWSNLWKNRPVKHKLELVVESGAIIVTL